MEDLVTGLVSPTGIVLSPWDAEAFYILDQPGVIYRVTSTPHGEVTTVETWMNLSDLVIPLDPKYDERGLLGLAFSPTDSNLVYVFYSSGTHSNILAEIRLDTGKVRVLLKYSKPRTNHNGGCLLFGPDKRLYVAIGDGGEQKYPKLNSQNDRLVLGKILRYDEPSLDESAPDTGGLDPIPSYEVFAKGLRNPWQMHFDRDVLYVGDVGLEDRESVFALDISKTYNCGWPYYEGTLLQPWHKLPREFHRIEPIYEFPHVRSKLRMKGVPTMISLIQGPVLGDRMIVGDYGGQILIVQGGQVKVIPVKGHVLAFGLGHDGRQIYVATSGADGPTGSTGKVRLLSL